MVNKDVGEESGYMEFHIEIINEGLKHKVTVTWEIMDNVIEIMLKKEIL